MYLTKDSPPTLLLYGTADQLAAQGDEFMKKSKELGHQAELFTAEGQKHGFFKRPALAGEDDAEDGRVPGIDWILAGETDWRSRDRYRNFEE